MNINGTIRDRRGQIVTASAGGKGPLAEVVGNVVKEVVRGDQWDRIGRVVE